MNWVRATHLPILMNITQIKNIQKILKNSINNINQQIIIRDCKLNFIWVYFFKNINNSSYKDVFFNKFRFY